MRFLSIKPVYIAVIIMLAIFLPILAFGGGKNIYVDKDAKGSETGTAKNPYHSIGKALKEAKSGDTVRVKNGTYKENIEIPSGVALRSHSFKTGDVTIKGDNNEPTVLMKHKSKLSKMTIEGGRHGIRVKENSKADIIDVLVKKSDRDGIHIDKSKKRDKKYRVYIEESEIRESDRTGVYSEEHYVVIVKSDIHNNGLDGIDFQGGVRAWLEDNRIKDNKGTGLKVNINDAEVWTKSLSIRENKKDGVEVYALDGTAGAFGLKKAKIIGNKYFGVAKLKKGSSNDAVFKKVYIDNSTVERNGKGVVSQILRSK